MRVFVGCRSFELADEELGVRVPLSVLYPTLAKPRPERIGPYRLEVARNAPLQAGAHPLVVISHGRGGSPWVYRTLALHLAQQGFIVGLPEHPGNNRHDNS